MNKDDILKDFDTLAEAKRKGAVNLKLWPGLCPGGGCPGAGLGTGGEFYGTG